MQGEISPLGQWLISTLIYWPLILPTLALGLEILPRLENAWSPMTYLGIDTGLLLAWSPTTYLGIGTGLLLVWLFTGIFLDREDQAVIGLGRAIAVLALIVVVLIGFLFEKNILWLIIGVFTFLISTINLNKLKYRAIVLIIATVLLGVIGSLPGLFAFATTIVIEQSEKTGRVSWLTQKAFGALLLANIFIIWYYFFSEYAFFNTVYPNGSDSF